MIDRQSANARINAALDTLRIYGWTTEQRNRLCDGLHREDAVELAERTAEEVATGQYKAA